MKPLAVIGEVSNDLKNKVFSLRKKIRELGYDSGEQYLSTIPHLTLAVNLKFEGEADKLKPFIANLDINKFKLKVVNFIFVDDNAAVEFENYYSKNLAKEISFALQDFKFEPVETYFMKLIRSEIKPKFQEKVKEMLKEIIPDQIEIIKISAAGGNLMEKDIHWSANLSNPQ